VRVSTLVKQEFNGLHLVLLESLYQQGLPKL
jgi:hypothetical protein